MLYGSTALKGANKEDTLVMTKEQMQPFVEAMLYDDVSRGSQEQIKEFCESPKAQVLMEKQVLKKGTMMRLSKADDEKRRVKLIAYQLAKADNDPNWKKMVEYRDKWKEYRQKVMEKYGARATKIAKEAQKEYIKKMAKEPNNK